MNLKNRIARLERERTIPTSDTDAWHRRCNEWTQRLVSGRDPGPVPRPSADADPKHWHDRLALWAGFGHVSPDQAAAGEWPAWLPEHLRPMVAERLADQVACDAFVEGRHAEADDDCKTFLELCEKYYGTSGERERL